MSISSCYNDIGKYNALKANLVSVANGLKRSADQLSSVPNIITSAYNVDDNSTPVVGKCNKLGSDIVGTFNYINGTVIPAIDMAIARKKNEISRLEAQARAEEAERIRRANSNRR